MSAMKSPRDHGVLKYEQATRRQIGSRSPPRVIPRPFSITQTSSTQVQHIKQVFNRILSEKMLGRILSKKMLGSVVTSSGKSLVLSAATKTTSWERPDYAAAALKIFIRDPQMKPKSRREGLLAGDCPKAIHSNNNPLSCSKTEEFSKMATSDPDNSTRVPVNDCFYKSEAGVITKLSDCGRSDCPNSDSYVPPKK
ncbi:hypothetical protein GE09DRAFT_1065059 [Coniochaeta sp. 2T2.1]|nr:hypothetical protein GE09DRAFT_1065059 [Coniochaeta sp. 2T2.1]